MCFVLQKSNKHTSKFILFKPLGHVAIPYLRQKLMKQIPRSRQNTLKTIPGPVWSHVPVKVSYGSTPTGAQMPYNILVVDFIVILLYGTCDDCLAVSCYSPDGDFFFLKVLNASLESLLFHCIG